VAPTNWAQRISRYEQFYRRKEPGDLLVVTDFPKQANGLPDLRTFDFSHLEEHRRYWDILVGNMRAQMGAREGVDDDWIPGITLHYGFGAFGAVYCDASLTFTEDTSYLDGIDGDWESMEHKLWDPHRLWARIFVEAARYLSAQARGDFMVEVYPAPSPLDVVNLLRGNRLFTDFYDYPRQLHRLLGRATQAVIAHARRIHDASPHPSEGRLAFNRWFPSGLLLLEDAADLCSSGTYLEFGLPYTQRVIQEMGGAYIHHHSLGRHQYRNMASLRGLHILQISSDPNCVRPVNELAYALSQTGSMALDIECSPAEVREHIGDLAGGRFVLEVACSSKEEAVAITTLVRNRQQSGDCVK